MEAEILYTAVFHDSKTLHYHPEMLQSFPDIVAEAEQSGYDGLVDADAREFLAPGGDFGHHALVDLMEGNLRGNHVAVNLLSVLHPLGIDPFLKILGIVGFSKFLAHLIHLSLSAE